MFGRTAPQLHNRSAPPGTFRLTVWDTNQSLLEAHSLLQCASPWLWSVLCLWSPRSRKGNSSSPLLLLGTGGKAAGWAGCCTVSLQSACNLWPPHFCTSSDLLGLLHSLRSPSGELLQVWSFLVQHPLISMKNVYFSDILQAACCHPFSCLMLLPQEVSAHSTNTVIHPRTNEETGAHIWLLSPFYKCPSFGKLNLKQWMQLQPNFQKCWNPG